MPSRQQASPRWQIWISLSEILLFNSSIDKCLLLFQQLMVWLHILTLPAYAIAIMQLQNALLSFPASPAPECEKCCIRNSHLCVGNSLGMLILSFFLSVISTYFHVLFLRGKSKTKGTERILTVGSHSLVHVLHVGWCINCKCMHMGGSA